jgi:ABC-2 type transport system permease protein
MKQGFFYTVKWYVRMIAAFVRISFLNQIEYRLNFIAGFFVEAAYALIKFTYFIVVLTSGASIGALTPEMVGLFIGTYMFMTGIWMMLSGINSLPGKVLRGELDALITKPGSLQVLQTMGRFNFAMATPNCVAGIILIVWSWNVVGIEVSFRTVGGFTLFMFLGMLLTYGFVLIPNLLIFWVTSINGVNNLFSALWDFNNMPMSLYGQTIKFIGTFIIPIFVITNWAGMFVLKQLTGVELVWGIALPIIVLILSRLLWRISIQRYTSANG